MRLATGLIDDQASRTKLTIRARCFKTSGITCFILPPSQVAWSGQRRQRNSLVLGGSVDSSLNCAGQQGPLVIAPAAAPQAAFMLRKGRIEVSGDQWTVDGLFVVLVSTVNPLIGKCLGQRFIRPCW